MTVYHLPIIFVLLAAFVSIARTKIGEQLLISIIVLLVVTIAGLRYYSDVDYSGYLDLFENTPALHLSIFSELTYLYGEPGYLLISSLFQSMGLGFFALTLVFSFISISLKTHVVLQTVENPSVVIAFYLCLYFITVEFIEMRWSVASAIICSAFYLHSKNRKIVSLSVLLVASTVHYFSASYFALLLLSSVAKLKWCLALAFTSLAIAISYKFFDLSFFSSLETDVYVIAKFLRYLNDPKSSLGFFSYLKVFMYLIYYSCYYYKSQNQAENNISAAISLSCILLSFSLLISFLPILFYRSMVIADFFSLIAVVSIVFSYKNVKERALNVVALSALFSTWSYLDVKNYYNAGYIFDYSTWLSFI